MPSAFKALFLALDSFQSKLRLVLTLPSYCLHVFPPGLELFLGGFWKPEVAGRGEGGSTCPCLLRSVPLDLVGVLGSWLLRITPSVLTFLFRFYYFFFLLGILSLFLLMSPGLGSVSAVSPWYGYLMEASFMLRCHCEGVESGGGGGNAL